jgi:beta-lactamase class A
VPSRRFKSRLSSSASAGSFWRSRRYRRSGSSRAWIAPAAAVALVALCGVGYAAFDYLPAPKPVVATKAVATAAPEPHARAPRARPLPGPAPLQARLDDIAKAYGEPVGIAVYDIEEGWAASVRGDEFFPQQSVSKTWVALAVLDAVDRGLLSIDSPVTMTLADRSVFNQPLGRSLDADGFVTDIPNLLRHALSFSDNSANDTLIRLIGLDAVRETLVRHGLSGIRMGADERHLQARIAGLVWKQDYSEGRNFEAARAKLDPQARREAMDAYLRDPIDGATPLAVVQALAALYRGEVLSPQSRALILKPMSNSRTGPGRLRGGLPAGWKIAHKTGTGQDLGGASIGINDIAILTAPDGQSYAVAVFIRRTAKPVRERLAMMQAVTRAVAENWRDTRKPAPPTPKA